jgi:hypothetical protein
VPLTAWTGTGYHHWFAAKFGGELGVFFRGFGRLAVHSAGWGVVMSFEIRHASSTVALHSGGLILSG